jgi:hypothetical protein
MIDWPWLLLIPIAYGWGWVHGYLYGTRSLVAKILSEIRGRELRAGSLCQHINRQDRRNPT